ncbi:MAG: dephospho-CoA kinase [Lysobacterales bacterium]
MERLVRARMSGTALRVGLTGGVASGKSAVAERLVGLGVTVLDADHVARELTEPGTPALDEIVRTFGASCRAPNGSLDRRALREIVFNNRAARLRLEGILHPRIRALLEERAAAASAPYIVVAVPLLAEVGRYAWLDAVVVVDVPRELQHARLLVRDGVDATLATRMLDAQATREKRLAIADYVIDNTGSLAELGIAVDALHAQLLARASSNNQTPRIPAKPNAPSART